jgi:hypothetical protein
MPAPEAEIIHKLPNNLAAAIGRIVVLYAKLEHKVTALSGLILQLDRAEMRVAIRTPRVPERLEMALDLLALKKIHIPSDSDETRALLSVFAAERDRLAHGIWLRHPQTKKTYLRIARGKWPKDMTRGASINRIVLPQAVPYAAKDAISSLAQGEKTLAAIDILGEELDQAMKNHPERFRLPLPILDPFARRKLKPLAPAKGKK